MIVLKTLLICFSICEEIWWGEQYRAILTKIHGLEPKQDQ